MRLLALLMLVAALHAVPTAQTAQGVPQQADPVVRLLADLESALERGQPDELRALASPALPEEDVERLVRTLAGGGAASATVRERVRRPHEDGFEVLADVLISRGRHGRLATWQLMTRPSRQSPDRFELTALGEVAAIDGLLRLTIETTKQFAVHNLSIQLTDLTLKMPGGTAFVAESRNGVTAIVLRGKAELHFSPPDPAEQGQLRIFAGRPSLSTEIDTAFIRMNPLEFAERVAGQSLQAARVNPNELRRAQETFDQLAPRTYNLDLRELTPERWSLEPSYGNAVVEFRTRRHGWLTYVRSPSDTEDVSLFDRARARNISIYASAEKLAERGRFYSEDSEVPYDVERYHLELVFDPARSWIGGRGSMRVRIKNIPTSTLTFRLAQPLFVSSVSSPGFGYLMALRVSGQNNVLVSLPKVLDRGAEFEFHVIYSGRLDPQGLDREAIAPQPQRPESSQPEPVVLPEPRYMYSNRVYWYPQSPVSDYATARMRLTVPLEYQIVGSGTVVRSSVTPVEGLPGTGRSGARFMRTVEYAADRPVRYLSCVISRFVPVGRLQIDVPAVAPAASPNQASTADKASPAVNVEVISTPRMIARNRQTPARAADILRFYAKTLGEAPYPDFTLAAIDDNIPGGHSPPFYAIWHQPLPTTPYVWTDDPVAFDQTHPFFFLAHEIAHQWWGQAVGWKNYHEQWISEGFAQYFATLYAGADRGPDVARTLISQMRATSAHLSAQGPIALGYRLGHIQNEGRIFRAIVYNKSAVVLHMLRRLVGDDAFFTAVRHFYRDWRFSKAGTDDFRAILETQTPLRLARFFDRWIFGSTLPRLRVATRTESDSTTAVVRIEQVGETFDLPLTFSVQYADGTSEEITIAITEPVVEHRVALKGRLRRIIARDELTLAEIVR